MKRILFLFISLMICVSGYSQKHMKFQGIEIDGTKKAFVDQLIKKGYEYEHELNNTVSLSGTFTGKKATILVVPNTDGDVSYVSLTLPYDSKWNNLLDEYNYHKNLYTQEYGTPVIVNEKDQTTNDDNDLKMEYLEDGRNQWQCVFTTEEGQVFLSIRGYKNEVREIKGYITIVYNDYDNFEKNKKQGN